jgi:hypothetical protein
MISSKGTIDAQIGSSKQFGGCTSDLLGQVCLKAIGEEA